jgi:hypothetical protein
MGILVTEPQSRISSVVTLWNAICDVRIEVEVASWRVFGDGDLGTADIAALDRIAVLRSRHSALSERDDLSFADVCFLSGLSVEIASLEGRREILLLATA